MSLVDYSDSDQEDGEICETKSRTIEECVSAKNEDFKDIEIEAKPVLPTLAPEVKFEDGKCGVCKAKDWKYKCPRCTIQTCSLPCIRIHKNETGCSGIRSQTHFVSLKEFDTNQLKSDFHFLENISRAINSNYKQDLCMQMKRSRKKRKCKE